MLRFFATAFWHCKNITVKYKLPFLGVRRNRTMETASNAQPEHYTWPIGMLTALTSMSYPKMCLLNQHTVTNAVTHGVGTVCGLCSLVNASLFEENCLKDAPKWVFHVEVGLFAQHGAGPWTICQKPVLYNNGRNDVRVERVYPCEGQEHCAFTGRRADDERSWYQRKLRAAEYFEPG